MTNVERIKALRNCADLKGTCDICEYRSQAMCQLNMINDAADALEAAEQRIAKLEAQLLKEGEWETTDNRWGCGKYRCTVCNSYENDKRNYCPNCGARMQTVTDCHTLEEGEHDE